ncbi:MAG: M48 family metalloprotease [Gammaproteobacteria bacterium]|nr:M48 family metalloprotease [Gammaproteobacteria bacterium]
MCPEIYPQQAEELQSVIAVRFSVPQQTFYPMSVAIIIRDTPFLTIIRRLLTMVIVPVLLGSICAAALADDLPDLGDESASVISAIDEQKIGRQFLREAREQLPFVRDPELNAYVTSLGEKLVAHSDTPQMQFRFYVIQDSQLNAFAVPGGHIAVHTGLILATEHESELAAVLSHEIAHISQRHLPRMLARSKEQTVPAMAAIAAAILLGGDAGTAALAATNAAIIERQLAYTRDFEEEADALGIRTLARANLDPGAMPVFFERMQRWSRIYESDVPEYLRTHPLTYKRIAESQARAESYPPAPQNSDDDFLHVKAKIRALFSQRSSSSTITEIEPTDHDSDLERYAQALSNTSGRRFDAARKELQALVAKHPDQVTYFIAQAENEMAAGEFEAALDVYSDAVERFPSSDLLQHYYASSLVRTGYSAKAKTLLRKAIRKDPKNPELYEMLARAEGDIGALFEAHQALAEFHYLNADTKHALEELRTALGYAGDSFYAKASAEARIREIEAEATLYDES